MEYFNDTIYILIWFILSLVFVEVIIYLYEKFKKRKEKDYKI